jgi:hypothetical protein
MTRQMFWRSEAVHEKRLAPLALGTKWWGVIGVLGAVGAAAYLLPSFADGRPVRGDQLSKAAGVQLTSANAATSGGNLLDTYSPPAKAWQNLPLLALGSSAEAPASGEVQVLALQEAFERERSSAAAAQLQVAALQEQVASLQEKQEEVLVLREQLADTEAQTRRITGPVIADTDQQKLAEQARLKVLALQEELASLRAQLLKATTAAENEKARAASALAQLEAVQRQLAGITALQDGRMETDRNLQLKDAEVGDRPALDSSRDDHPAGQASKLPLPLEADAVPSVKQQIAPHRSVREGKSERAVADKPRQALLNTGTRPQTKLVNNNAAGPIRKPEADASSSLMKSRDEPGPQSVRSVGRGVQRASQRPRLLVQDTQSRSGSGALSLPNELLPDSSPW